MSRRICTFEAAMNGMILSRTTMATTDHMDCAIALAAGGDVRAELESQFCSGHRASRPATPTNRRMEAAGCEMRPKPGGDGKNEGKPELHGAPEWGDQHAIQHRKHRSEAHASDRTD